MEKRWYLCIGYSLTEGFDPKRYELYYDFDFLTDREAEKYAYELAEEYVGNSGVIDRDEDMSEWEYDSLVKEDCGIRVYEIEGFTKSRDILATMKELGLADFITEYCPDTATL